MKLNVFTCNAEIVWVNSKKKKNTRIWHWMNTPIQHTLFCFWVLQPIPQTLLG